MSRRACRVSFVVALVVRGLINSGMVRADPPPNDNCANGLPVSFGVAFSTVDASTDGPDVLDACLPSGDPQIHADIWFDHAAAGTHPVIASVCGSNFDTRIAVYRGCTCPVSDANRVACNDNVCGLQSSVYFCVEAGNCYKIRIGGAPGASGTGSLSLSIPPAPVLIVSANPPTDNPFIAGAQPYRDVLQTGPAGALAQGIGGAATPVESAISYSPILVTFNLPPCPMPAPSTISISCTGGGAYPCPTIASVAGTGTNYQIMLTSSANGVIPPGGCTTLTFAGAFPGEKLQYQSLPGDMDMNGMVTTQDLLAPVHALQDGSAQIDVNVPRYDVNRSGVVDTTDLLRLVQLLNGTNAPQAFAGLTVAACP